MTAAIFSCTFGAGMAPCNSPLPWVLALALFVTGVSVMARREWGRKCALALSGLSVIALLYAAALEAAHRRLTASEVGPLVIFLVLYGSPLYYFSRPTMRMQFQTQPYNSSERELWKGVGIAFLLFLSWLLLPWLLLRVVGQRIISSVWVLEIASSASVLLLWFGALIIAKLKGRSGVIKGLVIGPAIGFLAFALFFLLGICIWRP